MKTHLNTMIRSVKTTWSALLKDFARLKGKNRSIKGNLLRYLLVGLPIIWLVSIVLAAVPIFHETNKQNDQEMVQMGHLLAKISVDFQQPTTLPSMTTVLSKKSRDYHQEMDTGFAIWDDTGQLLVATPLGKTFAYRANDQGFIDSKSWWRDAAVRVFYLTTSDGKTIAVGRQWDERLEITQTTMWAIFATLLLVVPLLIIFSLWAVQQGLHSVQQLSAEVDNRQADDLNALKKPAPQELQPFIAALNRLFARVQQTIEQEQRFTADAAHELRSPLAAIKAQSDVLMLTQDREKQLHHTSQIRTAADRATHLVEQLLTLSRLDPMTVADNGEPIDWLSVSDQALQSVHHTAREKRIKLQRHITADTNANILPLNGDTTLLILLLRNLLDNAVRYGVDGNHNVVELTLANDLISIRDHGKGIAPEHLARVRERFYRPAGQSEIGSGLGLSIVERIAELHGLSFSLDNHVDGGVAACITLKDTA